MLRSIASKPVWVIIAAIIWVAAILGITIARETPVGIVSGRVVASETGKPIVGAEVHLETDVEPYSPNWDYWIVKTDSKGNFRFTDIPTGRYTIYANGKVHNMEPQKLVVKEGRNASQNLEPTPSEPFVNLYVSQHVFMSKETPEAVIDGFTGGNKATVTISKINIDKLFSGKAGGLEAVLGDVWMEITPDMLENNPAVESLETNIYPITSRDSEGAYHKKLDFGKRPLGFYVIGVTVDGKENYAWFTVSDIGLVTKESGSSVLAYVIRSDSGAPVKGAEVVVLSDSTKLASGTTNQDGLWRTSVQATDGESDRLIMARLGDSIGMVQSYAENQSQNISIYTYTDRPVYRPGQQGFFKGIVRKFVGDAYQVPTAGTVHVEINDSRDTLVFSGDLPLSKFGSFNGSFKLPTYAATGSYTITCNYGGGENSEYFSVAEYRKPEFSVKVDFPKKRYKRGDIVKAKISAEYYFGAPVANAEVSYTISRSDYWFFPEDEMFGDSGYQDYGGYGESIKEGTIKTDSSGTAEIEFPATWELPKDEYSTTDQQFTVTADVTDPSRLQASGEGSVIATQGDFKLDIESDQYVASPGDELSFKIIAADYENRPKSHQDVSITANLISWEGRNAQFDTVSKATVTTDDKGHAVYSFKPNKPGDYVVWTESRDSLGNRIRSSSYVWVAGEGEISGYKYPDLQIVLDKKKYSPGDTAKVLINSSEKGAYALLTIEGRRLFDQRIVKLDNKTTIVEIPIKEAYAPNFFVSICYVKNKQFISQEAGASVSLKNHVVNLSLKPNKDKYEPGEEAEYLIKTTDSSGKPVQAEVSLGIVDEAIYAIEEDHTTPIKDFFYGRQWNTVTTRFSFPEVYMSGDKAGFTGKVREKMLDTAFWKADIVTDAKGEARVKFKMPDNLTTWRATARACTLDTSVAQAISKVVCTKKLLVRLEMPRFLVQSDETTVSAIVHNYLPESQRVKVAIDAPGLDIKGSLTRTITVPSNGVRRVDWRATASELGNHAITVYAVAPKAQDAMRLTIPVNPNGQKTMQSRNGSIANGVETVNLDINKDAIRGASEIRVKMAPSVASSMIGSLDYLAQYPYGCTEQTASTFLPDVVLMHTLKSLNISDPELEKKLPDMVGKGLNRLYTFQQENGGWGWCQYGSQDLWMTSYVVYAFLTAKSVGVAVNEDVLNNGITALQTMVQNEEFVTNDKVYGIYVLSLAGKADIAKEQLALVVKHPKLTPQSNAYVALTLANLGDSAGAKSYIDKLWAQSITDSAGIHWEYKSKYYYMPYTDITAQALYALVKLTPDDPRIPDVVRWLMSQMSYDHWYSTRDTAFVLYAMSDYLAKTKELNADFTADVIVNGNKVQSMKFDKSSIFQPDKEVVIPAKFLHDGANSVQLDMKGVGKLYYTAELTQYLPFGSVKNNPDITVSREYRQLISSKTGPSSTSFKSGDVIRVKVTVNSKQQYSQLIIEDYLPAGCEAFDQGSVDYYDWTYWWVEKDVRDNRVTFYIDTLKKGKNVVEYEMRAGIPGTYLAIPTLVESMYNPSINSTGRPTSFRISE